ncbi:hypothetical protein [Gemmata sp.]|uniref:hypothetical protein n=1 Tax=Gemmata sp. TaxID=1914242 RepID=UPI003F6F60C3
MFGDIGPTLFPSHPSAANTASKWPFNFESWSIKRCVADRPQSAICIDALRACCLNHSSVGLAEIPTSNARWVPTWMTNSRYRSTNPPSSLSAP